jgi:hypothetical protein
MKPRYSAAYIDRLVRERDGPGLHQLISVFGRYAQIPDELWVFNHLLEWAGSTRSGVWQYYETVDPRAFTRLKDWLERAGWHDLHTRYARGMLDFASGQDCEDLDRWLLEHEDEVDAALWATVTRQLDRLKELAD